MLVGAGMLPLIYYLVLPEVSERGLGRVDQWLTFIQEGTGGIQSE